MQFGISTHLFHNHRLDEQHLRQVADHGFDSVELFAVRGHFEYHDRAAIEQLGRWLDATGLRLHSVHAPIVDSLVGSRWGAAYNNATIDDGAREQAVREAIAAAQLAAIVPYNHLIVHLGLPTAQRPGPGDNNRDRARRSVEQVYEAARQRGVRLALEVIPNELSSPDALIGLIEDNLELPDVGICLDFGHAFLMGDLLDAIETTSGHLVTTHVHDNRGKADDHLVPFEGNIDWPAALTSVQKVGYDGTLLFELQSAEPALTVLERAVRVRRRFEELLGTEWSELPIDQVNS